jgi:hypothetical protein
MVRGSKVDDLAWRNPITGIGSCARAVNDHATAAAAERGDDALQLRPGFGDPHQSGHALAIRCLRSS